MPATSSVTTRARGGTLWAAVFLLVVVCAGVYVWDLGGLGRSAQHLVYTLLVLLTAVGPFARGARPVWLWVLIPAAMALLWGSVVFSTTTALASPPETADVLMVAGYVLFAAWVLIVAFKAGRRDAVQAILDSTAATLGFLLAVWTVSANVFNTSLTNMLAWAVYPMLNVLLVGFTAPLAWNLGRMVPAWRLLTVGLSVQLLIDMSATFAVYVASLEEVLYLSAAETFTFFFIAAAACHPSVAEMSTTPLDSTPLADSSVRRIGAVMVALVPAVVSLHVPITSRMDEIVRTVLVVLLCAVLLVRLFSSMIALARAEEESRHRADHDELTGLPNRRAMFEALTAHLKRGDEVGVSTAMLFIDCDGFKQVNDTWGHAMGDVLLRTVAEQLPQWLPEGDYVARHGGDEFVVVAAAETPDEVVDRARIVLDYFASTHEIAPGLDIRLTCSIGIAVARPHEGLRAADLMGRAEMALFEAKARGRDRYEIYGSELHLRTTERAALAEALRRAIAEDRLTVAFQPLMGGPGYSRLIGWEALARWTEPGYGAVRPDVFIAVAEELGLIHDLGENVLRRSCRELAELRRTVGPPDGIVSVNVSGFQLNRPSFPEMVRSALSDAGLDGAALWLEITESHLVEGGDLVLEALHSLRRMGVSVVLDDFGTGYSSLATLNRLPFDVVKLDRSLVADLDDTVEGSAKVRALIDLLTSMGLHNVVAEGVETEEQARALEAVGCPFGQGWHFGYPTAPEDILANATELLALTDGEHTA